MTQDTAPKAGHTVFVKPLPDNVHNSGSLLKPPESCSLRAGYVALAPNEAGQEHSTESYEEMLVILSGSGMLHYSGTAEAVAARSIAYIPPHTKHFVQNTGSVTLSYVYIVTKVEL